MKINEKLAAVQNVIEQPKFDSTNPHFKSKFASLAECNRVVMDAIRKVGGCAVYQKAAIADDGSLSVTTVFTAGDEAVELSTVPYNRDANPQKMGSGITYARRYSLCAAFCLVADEDDDGNAASAPRKRREGKQADVEEFMRLREVLQSLAGCGKAEADAMLAQRFGTTEDGKLDRAKIPQMNEWLKLCEMTGCVVEDA